MKEPTLRELRRENWKNMITACNNSGLTKKQWCEENGVSTKAFYYHQKQLMNELSKQLPKDNSEPVFYDVTPQLQSENSLKPEVQATNNACKPDLVIRKGDLVFEIANSISPNLLKMLGGILNA